MEQVDRAMLRRFPSVTARNLDRNRVVLPDGLDGQLNVLLIAFQQWQQQVVDTWLPFVQQLEGEHMTVRYYELPVIQRLNALARTFINEGMRAGIPDPLARERTITLYLDKVPFRHQLGISSEDDISVLLVDREGRVFWSTEGAFSSEKGNALIQAINEQTSEGKTH